MTREQFAELLVDLFPEKADSLALHYEVYQELLGHVFFAHEINSPLRKLLYRAENMDEIGSYCDFIEKMWFDGDDDVKNIVTVTIVEGLSEVWENFGRFLTKAFIGVINDEIRPDLAVNVPRLSWGQENSGKGSVCGL